MLFILYQISTESSQLKGENELVDVLQSISTKTEPTVSPTKPKLNKRTTDTVLSSLLTAIGAPQTNDINEITSDSLKDDISQRHSSGSLVDSQSSDHSVELEVSSEDSDYEDVDVFDMLQDNSDTRGTQEVDGTLGIYTDIPPPLPTTPIPSDDDDDVPLPPPRRESLQKSDYSPHQTNGYGSLHNR